VGKTTSVINLAYNFAKAGNGMKILVVDCDSQMNCFHFFGGESYKTSPPVQQAKRYENITITRYTGNARFDIEDESYDIVLFDCPPALNENVKNTLSVCDYVFAPLELGKFAVEGLKNVQEEIIKSNAKFGGVFICKYDRRSAGVNEMLNFAAEQFGENLLHTVIPESFAIKNSVNYDLTASEYMNNSSTLKYSDLAEEILERTGSVK
jgi:chromosome partitioning protein